LLPLDFIGGGPIRRRLESSPCEPCHSFYRPACFGGRPSGPVCFPRRYRKAFPLVAPGCQIAIILEAPCHASSGYASPIEGHFAQDLSPRCGCNRESLGRRLLSLMVPPIMSRPCPVSYGMRRSEDSGWWERSRDSPHR
jgi:hypothetical protein